MTRGETVSPARSRPTVALVVATVVAFCLLGCRVTLRFDQPEGGADARQDDLSCTTDQQCSSLLPRCSSTTGHCVGCLTKADCAANQFCDPDSSRCRTDL